jgi:hypothetical protein
MNFEEIEKIVTQCLEHLCNEDFPLLTNDVSERAITHRLAEYLQSHFKESNVDCEYNRNTVLGPLHKKELRIERDEIAKKMDYSKDEDDLLAISTYPDIIVHTRETNDKNLLVVEVKKKNSKVSKDLDHRKLRAFTEVNGDNPYHYQYGVFILIETGSKEPEKPKLTWFIEGKEK